MRGRGYLALLALCAIVVACGSPTASPSPRFSPSPSSPATPGSPAAPGVPGPSPSPSAPVVAGTPWTFETGEVRGTAFGRDGTTYLFSWFGESPSQLIALDREGSLVPGWPAEMGTTGIGAGPVELSDGNVAVLTFAYQGDVESYALQLVAPDGTPVDGWPYLFPPGQTCADIEPLASGVVAVACGSDQGTTITAIDPNGDVAWEATTDLPAATQLDVSAGTVYATALGSRGGVAAFDESGVPVNGWPFRIPDLAGATLTPAGGILAWWRQPVEEICWEAPSTGYLVLDPSGTALEGWPQTLEGYASDPVVGPDASIYVVTKDREAFAFGPDGAVRSGWPAQVSLNTGHCFGPPTPVLGPDGTLYVATGGEPPDGGLTAIGGDGQVVEGWPFAPAGELAYPCRAGCTPGPYEPFGPIVVDDRVWTSVYPQGDDGTHVEVLAVNGAGQPIADSLTQLASPEAILMVSPDDRLFAILIEPETIGQGTFAFLGPAR